MCRGANGGSERLSHLSQVAELVEPKSDSRGCAHLTDEETEAEEELAVAKTSGQ